MLLRPSNEFLLGRGVVNRITKLRKYNNNRLTPTAKPRYHADGSAPQHRPDVRRRGPVRRNAGYHPRLRPRQSAVDRRARRLAPRHLRGRFEP